MVSAGIAGRAHVPQGAFLSIWGREKLIDENFALLREVLHFNGLGEDFLHYYDTPEPFLNMFIANRLKCRC